MSFISWNLPIGADSYRSTELKGLKFDRSGLVFELVEEDAEETWRLSFGPVHAFRITAEECGLEMRATLPDIGGFFKSTESTWLTNLGKGEIHFLDNACHFVICSYDEIIEIVADPSRVKFVKIESSRDRAGIA